MMTRAALHVVYDHRVGHVPRVAWELQTKSTFKNVNLALNNRLFCVDRRIHMYMSYSYVCECGECAVAKLCLFGALKTVCCSQT